jgi:hypothetical protein
VRVDVRVHDGDVQRLADRASAGSFAALEALVFDFGSGSGNPSRPPAQESMLKLRIRNRRDLDTRKIF